MPDQINTVSIADLDRLNPKAFSQKSKIVHLLQRLMDDGTVLMCGIDRNNNVRSAKIRAVTSSSLQLEVSNFDQPESSQIHANFNHNDSSYFFATALLERNGDSHVFVEIPNGIYRSERRDRFRQPSILNDGEKVKVSLQNDDGTESIGLIADWSEKGLGIDIPDPGSRAFGSEFSIRFLDGSRAGENARARLHHISRVSRANRGWIRLGLSIDQVRRASLINIDRRDRIMPASRFPRNRDIGETLGSAAEAATGEASSGSTFDQAMFPAVPIDTFANDRGERIVAIVDTWGDPDGATAVVIPPAWGRTKETLMPLAMTIVATFREAKRPIIVLRFDGTNRRGESFIDPQFDNPGEQYLGFTFSQASRDIAAAVKFLQESRAYNPASIVLATFSLAAIEARHAIATDDGRRIDGWVSTVGMTDLQSALRTISGGVDYAYGLLSGVRFGKHELVGVTADMDRTGLDAIKNQMVFLEDARNEMSKIQVPITWIHGRDDAWIDIDRARDILSFGSTENRKLIEVPTGHQLRTSRIAMQTFQLIAEEISEMVFDDRLPAAIPRFSEISSRSASERDRRPSRRIDLRRFWGDYLLGRDRRIGMQLLTATNAYRSLMRSQISALQIEEGDRIADLGAGTGAFRERLNSDLSRSIDVTVCELDFVDEALRRNRGRDADAQLGKGISAIRAIANLDLTGSPYLSLQSNSFDSIMVSLLVGYLSRPAEFLSEVLRVLRPGGRVVVSALRRDADISKLFVDGIKELKSTTVFQDYSDGSVDDQNRLVRDFLNDASQILNLEEDGQFQFWEIDEFQNLMKSIGFVGVECWNELGDPPQAIVASATRPDSV